MKKILAIVLVAVMLFSLPVAAFAAVSPSGNKQHVIVVVYDDGTKPEKQTYDVTTEIVDDMEVLTFTAHDPSEGGTFDGWKIFRKDGSEAVESEDYLLIGSSYTEIRIALIPFRDLIIVATYDGKEPDLTEAMKLFDSESPDTGDTATVALVSVLALAIGGACLTKKQLTK